MLEHRPVYSVNGETVVLDLGRETLFRYIGETRNVRKFALADAVEVDGGLLTVHVEDGRILLQHNMAGVEERYAPTVWLPEPVSLFERCEYTGSLGSAPLALDAEPRTEGGNG